MIDVSIIIVNYKLSQFISRHIQSIFKEGLSTEVIIVDNSEDEIEKKILEKLSKEFPVKVIFNKKNLGFSSACNIGVKNSKGKYIFFLNPDAYLLGDSLKKLFYFCIENNIDAAGPRIFLDNFMSIKQPPFYPPTLLTEIIHNIFPRIFSIIWKKISYNFWNKKKPFKTKFLSGAAFIIKKELAKFDERFFMYFEDADLFMNLSKQNKKVFVFPDSHVVHEFDLSPSTKKNILFEESRKIFYKKYYPNFRWLISLSEKYKRHYIDKNATALHNIIVKKYEEPVEISLSPDFVPFVTAKLNYSHLPSFILRMREKLIARPALN